MGKKKKNLNLQIIEKKPEKRAWEIDWNSLNTFEALREAKDKFKLILESPVGNRDEDVLDVDFDGCISDSDSSDILSEQNKGEINT